AAGTLDMNSHNNTNASLSGGGSIINNSGTLTVSGNLSTTSFNAYSCFFGPISGGTLVKDGTHAMSLRQTNLYGVTLNYNGGVLSVGAGPERLPPATALTVPAAGMFQLDASSQTLSSLAGSGNV